MKIETKVNGTVTTLALEGRLDTATVTYFEVEVKRVIGNTTELYFDLAKLDYISSAGLRVILMAQKTMNKRGKMIIQNANEMVMEIFEVTGFIDILTIE